MVALGSLTGADVKLNVRSLYTRQIKLIGSTGGTRKERHQLIDLAYQADLRVKVWKKFKLEEVRDSLQALFANERDGRIFLDLT